MSEVPLYHVRLPVDIPIRYPSKNRALKSGRWSSKVDGGGKWPAVGQASGRWLIGDKVGRHDTTQNTTRHVPPRIFGKECGKIASSWRFPS